VLVKGQAKLQGAVLIFVAIGIYVLSLPALVNATDTSDGNFLENETEQIKTIYEMDSIIVALMPIFMFVIGVGLLFKG